VFDLLRVMCLFSSICVLTNVWQEGRRRALTENFAMRKVLSRFGGDVLYSISHLPLSLFAGRALACKGRGQGDAHMPALTAPTIAQPSSILIRLPHAQVMESQGQLPLQGEMVGDSWRVGADDECGPLLQVRSPWKWHAS
jgi:hypothetical protein